VDFGDFDALSFDCYGTLIDWETGIAGVLAPWAHNNGLDLTDEALLTAYSTHEAQAEADHPADRYPLILARSLRELGRELGVPVTDEDANRLGASVPDWPAFPDSPGALQALAQRPGFVKSRDSLMDAAYDDQVYVDDRTIDSHIKRLRKKFKVVDDDFEMIETLYGVGYRFKEA